MWFHAIGTIGTICGAGPLTFHALPLPRTK